MKLKAGKDIKYLLTSLIIFFSMLLPSKYFLKALKLSKKINI